MPKDKSPETTALTTTTSNYLALNSDAVALRSTLEDNIGVGGIGEFDLDRVRVPAGGGRTWVIPGLEGEEEVKRIEGIIVHWTQPRAYWRVALEEGGGGVPPDCSSTDGIAGTGTPGGACSICPMDKYKTAAKGGGKACKETKRLFILRENDTVPLILVVPPGSLGVMKKYFLRLATGRPRARFNAVVTRFELASAKSGNITYSKIIPAMVRRLEPSEVARIEGYAAAMGPMFARESVIDITEVSGGE